MLNLEDTLRGAVFSINLHDEAPLPLIQIGGGGVINTLKTEILPGMERTFTGGASSDETNQIIENYLQNIANEFCKSHNCDNMKEDIEKAISYFNSKSETEKEKIITIIRGANSPPQPVPQPVPSPSPPPSPTRNRVNEGDEGDGLFYIITTAIGTKDHDGNPEMLDGWPDILTSLVNTIPANYKIKILHYSPEEIQEENKMNLYLTDEKCCGQRFEGSNYIPTHLPGKNNLDEGEYFQTRYLHNHPHVLVDMANLINYAKDDFNRGEAYDGYDKKYLDQFNYIYLNNNIFIAKSEIMNAEDMKLFRFEPGEIITTINQVLDRIRGSPSDVIEFSPYLSYEDKNYLENPDVSATDKDKYIRNNLKTIVDPIWTKYDDYYDEEYEEDEEYKEDEEEHADAAEETEEAAAEEDKPVEGIEVIPSNFKGINQPGDFNWEILNPDRTNSAETLYIFNDNHNDHATAEAGNGNAVIRQYNRYSNSNRPNRSARKLSEFPASAGICTGGDGIGYKTLDQVIKGKYTVRDQINSDVKEIREILKRKYSNGNKAYEYVQFSSDGNGGLGTSIFVVGDEVKRHILKEIKKLGT